MMHLVSIASLSARASGEEGGGALVRLVHHELAAALHVQEQRVGAADVLHAHLRRLHPAPPGF